MLTKIKFFAVLALLLLTTVQCTKEEETPTRELSIQITDAPIDDQNVKAVFITVAQVKIDGKVFNGFSGKQTFDIKALQNGAVRVLGVGEVAANAATDISLVLDLDTDAAGNAMGCYVEMLDGTKKSLAAGATGTLEVGLKNAVDVLADASATVEVVMDFDLRKAIMHQANNNGNYAFVSSAELSAACRGVVKSKTGNINGNCSQNATNYDKVVVYAYKVGGYTSAEQNAQGDGNVQFANAVTSVVADANGNFNLSFLEAGEYELVCAAYNYDNNNNKQAAFQGMLQVGTALSGNILNTITIEANVQANLNISLFGIL